MRRHVAPAIPRVRRERAREALDGIAVDPAGEAVEDEQKPDEDGDDRQHRRVLDGPDDDAFDEHAGNEREGERQPKASPVGKPRLDEGPGDVG